jgi:hypothetical protein
VLAWELWTLVRTSGGLESGWRIDWSAFNAALEHAPQCVQRLLGLDWDAGELMEAMVSIRDTLASDPGTWPEITGAPE